MVFIHNIDPVFLNIFGVKIYYYGLMYIIGFTLGYFFLNHFRKKGQLQLTEEELIDFILYLAVGVLLGSRIFYFLFYNFGALLNNPLEFLFLWHGGMSFHGGLIGVTIAGILFCKLKKKSFFHIADYVVIPAVIALGFGRIGNFINGELFGRPTSLPWAFNFGDGIPRHPSQLYESTKNFFMFTVLWLIKDKILPTGFRFWFFVTMYGTLRFTIEFVREPDPQLGFIFAGLTMGQLLSSAMIVVGGCMLWLLISKHTKKQ